MCKSTEASPERQDLVPCKGNAALRHCWIFVVTMSSGQLDSVPATGPSDGLLLLLLLLFSHSVVSNSLRPHGQQHHARLPCPSLSPGVCSNSCPLSR